MATGICIERTNYPRAILVTNTLPLEVPQSELSLVPLAAVRDGSGAHCLMSSNPNEIWGLGVQAQSAVLTYVWLKMAKKWVVWREKVLQQKLLLQPKPVQKEIRRLREAFPALYWNKGKKRRTFLLLKSNKQNLPLMWFKEARLHSMVEVKLGGLILAALALESWRMEE